MVGTDKKTTNSKIFTEITLTILFAHKWEDVIVNTQDDGYTTMKPYKLGLSVLVIHVILNAPCVAPMLSSAWETEARKQGKIEPWMEKSL